MPVDRSELSSIAALVEQVTVRIATMAESAAGGREESVATELFGIERSLLGAKRRLERLLNERL